MIFLFLLLFLFQTLFVRADFNPDYALTQSNFSLDFSDETHIILVTEGVGTPVTGGYLDALGGAYQLVRINSTTGKIRTSPYDDTLGINNTIEGLSNLIYNWSIDLSPHGMNYECMSVHPISGKVYAVSQNAADPNLQYLYFNKLINYTVIEIDLYSQKTYKLWTEQVNFFQFTTGNGGVTDCTFSPDGEFYLWSRAPFSGVTDDVFQVDLSTKTFIPILSGSPNGQTNTMFFYPRINSLVHQYGARFDALYTDHLWYYGYNSNSFVYDRYPSAYFPTEFDYSDDKGQGLWRLSTSVEWWDGDSFISIATRREGFTYTHPVTGRSNTFCEQSHLVKQFLLTGHNLTLEESDNIGGQWAPSGTNGCNVGAITVLRKPQFSFDLSEIFNNTLTINNTPLCSNCSQEKEYTITLFSTPEKWNVTGINGISWPFTRTVSDQQDLTLNQECDQFFHYGETELVQLQINHGLFTWQVNYTMTFENSGCHCDSTNCVLNENTTLTCHPGTGLEKMCSECQEGWSGPDCMTDIDIPVIVCPLNITVYTESNKNYTSNVTWGPILEAYDNGDFLLINSSHLNGSDFYFGQNKITYFLSDGNNTVNCTFTVNVKDLQLPEITCPQDILAETLLDKNHSEVIIFDTANVSDNVGIDYISISTGSNRTFYYGSNLIIYTVYDLAGNEQSCQFIIYVEDNQKPKIHCPGDITITTFDTDYHAPEPISHDNVEIYFISVSQQNNYTFGQTEITYIAYDLAGNNVSCSTNITVIDTEKPSIECPENVIDYITTNNNYTTNVTLPEPVEISDNIALDSLTLYQKEIYYYGLTEILYIINDTSGNQANCTFQIEIKDLYPPIVTCPLDTIVETYPDRDYAMDFYFNGNATITDNIKAETLNYIGPGDYLVGNTTIVYIGTDSDSNNATCSFNVYVFDLQPPTIDCPENIIISTDLGKNYSSNIRYNYSNEWDNVAIEYIYDPYHGGFDTNFILGVNTIEIVIRDTSDNEGSCSFTITVEDTEAPEIICPNDITVENDYGQAGAYIQFDRPEVYDNTDVYEIIGTFENNQIFPIGSSNVIITVTDSGDLSASCSFIITVIDTERPTANCPQDLEIGVDDFIPAENVVWEDFSCQDNSNNCIGEFSINSEIVLSGENVFGLGETEVLYTVVDGYNNTDSCDFSVEVSNVCENVYCFGYIDPCYTVHDYCVVSENMGFCDYTLHPAGTPCVENNTYVCNGIGNCVFYTEIIPNYTCINNQMDSAGSLQPEKLLIIFLIVLQFVLSVKI